MAEYQSDETSGNLGPPASNLRKNSGRTSSVELNMVTLSDKSEPQGKSEGSSPGKSARKKKLVKKSRKKNPSGSKNTPSVKTFFTRSNDYQGNSTNPNSTEETFGVEGEVEDSGDSDPELVFTHRHPPVEDWNDDDSGWNNHKDEEGPYGRAQGTHQQKDYSKAMNDPFEGIETEIDIDNMDIDQLKSLTKVMFVAVKEMYDKVCNTSHVAGPKDKGIEDKVKLIMQTVIRNDRAIISVNNKINQVDQKVMRNNLIITGIRKKENENCKEIVQSFFKEKLKITWEIAIQSAHRLNSKDEDNRPILVKLMDAGDKGVIYKNAKHLKGMQNEKGGYYFINDQVSEKQGEVQRKHRQKVKLKKQLIDAQQQELEFKKGELYIDGAPYKPKVSEPTNAELLEMDEKQVKTVLAYKVHQGPKVNK